MIETAMVFTESGAILYWHDIDGRTENSIPDSRKLWDVLWRCRDHLGGVAHSHPWNGPSAPSYTDLTTFRAIEAALGRKLLWPIVTMTHVNFFARVDNVHGGVHYGLVTNPFIGDFNWRKAVELMRDESREVIQ